MGLQQITKSILFLHTNASLVFLNFKPENIVLTKRGAWKICGFEFAMGANQSAIPSVEYPFTMELGSDSHLLSLQPYLEYLAPEIIYLKRYGPKSDSFSLGCIIYELYTGKKLLTPYPNSMGNESIKDVASYKAAIERLHPVNLTDIPLELHKVLPELLSIDPNRRMSIQEFLDSAFFNDIVMRSIGYLGSLIGKDPAEKTTFFKGLAGVIPKVATRIIRIYMLQPILAEFKSGINGILITLPTIMSLIEKLDKAEFSELLLPYISQLLSYADPIQIPQTILENSPLLLSKLPEHTIATYFIPFLLLVLDTPHPQLHDQVLRQLPNLSQYLPLPALKQFLPRVEVICMNCVGLRVNALVCIGKLAPALDKQTAKENVVPLIERLILTDRSSAVFSTLLSMINIISKQTYGDELGATRLLPTLSNLCVDPSLEQQQFVMLIKLIKAMIDRIETTRLQEYEKKKAAPPAPVIEPVHVLKAPPPKFEDLVAREFQDTPERVVRQNSGPPIKQAPTTPLERNPPPAPDAIDFHFLVSREEATKQGKLPESILTPTPISIQATSSMAQTQPLRPQPQQPQSLYSGLQPTGATTLQPQPLQPQLLQPQPLQPQPLQAQPLQPQTLQPQPLQSSQIPTTQQNQFSQSVYQPLQPQPLQPQNMQPVVSASSSQQTLQPQSRYQPAASQSRSLDQLHSSPLQPQSFQSQPLQPQPLQPQLLQSQPAQQQPYQPQVQLPSYQSQPLQPQSSQPYQSQSYRATQPLQPQPLQPQVMQPQPLQPQVMQPQPLQPTPFGLMQPSNFGSSSTSASVDDWGDFTSFK
eukprot:TRINITY_DN10702_c0_g1_i1.p1 TRINITY_DN10702_c0_g1~~TRINITY_DN10702_c0_g1_i1.p1  ORF type:complete len:812 (+),score=152.43 TRINITY_DN10702_c0_g1_i1:356-2791(+)